MRNLDVQVKWASVQWGEDPGALKNPKKFIFLKEAAVVGWEPRAGWAGRTLPKGGAWLMWTDWVLAAARLDLSSHSLLVQFDPVSVALLVRQAFVVGQDVLHQETRRLVHVDVVLGKDQNSASEWWWDIYFERYRTVKAMAGRQRRFPESQCEASRDEVKTVICVCPSHCGQKLSSSGLKR